MPVQYLICVYEELILYMVEVVKGAESECSIQ